MLLKTERLNIRPVVEEDWRSILEIRKDFAVSSYAQYDKPFNTDPDDVRPRIAKWANANRNGMEHMFYAICVGETMIGYIAFNIREDGYEIGYCFHSAYHGKGYAKEILRLALEYARTEIGLEKIMIACYKENAGSWKTILANGGRLEREFVHTDGKIVRVYWVNL